MSKFIFVIQRIWNRIPIIFKAIIGGFIVAASGTIPWSVLTYLNINYFSKFPWSIPFMIVYLIWFWKYCGGYGWPASTSEKRRAYRRSRRLGLKTWVWSLLFGAMAFISLYALIAVAQRLISLPVQGAPEHLDYPMITLIGLFLMGNIVTGLVEETSFRGFMQTPLETRYGLTVAVIIVGTIFGLSHLSHSWMSIKLLPIYIVISAVYGVLVYTTGSLLPGIVLHAAGNTISGIYLKLNGPVAPPSLLWDTGADLSFWMNLLIAMTACFFAFIVYSKLKDEIEKKRI